MKKLVKKETTKSVVAYNCRCGRATCDSRRGLNQYTQTSVSTYNARYNG